MSWDFEAFSRDLDFLGRIFSSRLNRLSGEGGFGSLIRYLDRDRAVRYAYEYFGDGDWVALGIDGSMEHRERLEVLILYVAVASYRCKFTVSERDVEVDLSSVERDSRYTSSAIIPLWLDDINEFLGSSELGVARSLDTIIGNMPFSIMTFGEYYMGLSAATDDEVKIIFFDRPFASSIGPYGRDLRRLIYVDDGGVLTKLHTPRLTKGDLYLGLYHGVENYRIRPEKPYLIHYITQQLIRGGGEAYINELVRDIRVDREKIVKRVRRLNNLLDGTLIEEITPTKIILNRDRLSYWERIKKLIQLVGRKLFGEDRGEHPLYLGDGRWIGARELNAVTLYTIYEAINQMHRSKKLFVGVGKDTYVTDLSRALIHITNHLGITKIEDPPIKSDKPLLTTLSTTDQETFKTPWRLITYDGVVATLAKSEKPGAPTRPARRRLTQNRLIARSYFQLRTLRGINNINVKSPVFFYDRFLTPEDMDKTVEIPIAINDKKIDLEIYLETGLNEIDNLILYILSKMDKPEIAEATGHNYLLFLADKDVKVNIKLVKDAVINAVDTKIAQIIRDRNIYVVTRRFREYRHIVERRRSR